MPEFSGGRMIYRYGIEGNVLSLEVLDEYSRDGVQGAAGECQSVIGRAYDGNILEIYAEMFEAHRNSIDEAAGGGPMTEGELGRAADPRTKMAVRVLGPADGDILGVASAVRDRFMVSGKESGGGFSLVEHLMPPRALAAPLHRHSREDEYSFVLEGRVGALFEGQEAFANVGDLVVKPRGEWHTFWNAGDAPARILEIISPGGFEQAFREMHALGDALDPATMAAIAARYGVEVDFERTGPIIERHGLTF